MRAGLLAAGTVLLVGAFSTRAAERRAPCPHSLMPAYLYPNELMQLVERGTLPELIVFNPASGPGATRNPTYSRAVAAARAGGSRILGYVPTTWGVRPAAEVDADVDRYRRWYAVDGVFFDEASSSSEALTHYAALSRHARAAGARLVVLNPGVVPARGYFDLADLVVTFEGPYAAYREHSPGPEIDPSRTAHLVYGASREQAREALRSAPAAAYVYFTSGTPPHPWGTVPEYLGGCT